MITRDNVLGWAIKMRRYLKTCDKAADSIEYDRIFDRAISLWGIGSEPTDDLALCCSLLADPVQYF